jgi:hypothetical protein
LKDGLATNKSDQEKKYSLGFSTRELSTRSWIVPRIHSLTFGHSGGAVGCTSNLIIIPSQKEEGQQMGPQGIVVIIAGNLTHASGIKDAS